MLISNLCEVGNKLYKLRKSKGLTQAEVAEKAELSDRTYADIERGNVNMRLETLLKICNALNITPNDILTTEEYKIFTEAELVNIINSCTETEKQTVLNLLYVYIKSLNK